ncbi:MAG: radical SAM protein [Candidatus Pacearchaeota archaeon]|jgi:radical SAM superfamily enzyme YgiQ (UPF0313 family)
MELQLIFPKHQEGKSLLQEHIPPLGLLTIASYIKAKKPKQKVEVFDGNSISDNELIQKINAEMVGISVWFSNYDNGLKIAKRIKEKNPNTKIVFGGPNTNGIAERILKNNHFIDFVISGDGEESLLGLLQGRKNETIAGLTYRKDDKIISNTPSYSLDLNKLPPLNLKLLKTPFKWDRKIKRMGHSYFPLSRYRGCFRAKRCQYCSIPLKATRKSSSKNFWKDITNLNKKYGVDHFFETADTFPLGELKSLAKSKPKNLKFKLRCYIAPSTINEDQIKLLSKIGVKQVFIGVENSRFYADTNCTPISFKRYPDNYTSEDLLKEIDLFAKYNIDVMPSYVLGMPDETRESLKENIALIEKIANKKNVSEMSINLCLPLPGSSYFLQCVSDSQVIKRYLEIKKQDIRTIDDFDIHLLSKLFIERYSKVSYEEIVGEVKSFMLKSKKNIAHWGM